jgi:Domain of unknown function (DUF1902)
VLHFSTMRNPNQFDVEVTFDDSCDMWVAVCDPLFVTAEASTFEELSVKVWDLVPESIELNDLSVELKSLRLNFEITQDADHCLMLA